MPQTIVENRNFCESRKYDAPVSAFGDESSTTSDSFDDFLKSCQPNASSKGRVNGNVTCPISVSTNNEIGCSKEDTFDCDLDFYFPPKVINGAKTNSVTSEKTLFGNPLTNTSEFNSLKSNNMKLKNESGSEVLEDFSSLLSSISFQDPKSNGFSSNASKTNIIDPDSDFTSLLSSISCPDRASNDFSSNANLCNGANKDHYSEDLTSLLLSISCQDQTSNECSSDAYLWNIKDPESNRANHWTYNSCNNLKDEPKCNGSLTDILSSFGTPSSSSFESQVDNKTPTSSIKVPKSSSKPCPKKYEEFSFFSISPENVFPQLITDLKEDSGIDQDDVADDSPGVNMLELFNSMNSDSSSYLSEYFSSQSDDSPNETEPLSDLLKIDLSSCVKINDTVNIPEPPVEKCFSNAFVDDDEPENHQTFLKITFDETDCSKHPRMNLKQSLLAKSLACRPKKNRIALQKVASIKTDLFNLYFNRPSPCASDVSTRNDSDFKKLAVVDQSNRCMVVYNGRHFCSTNSLVVQ